MQCMHQVDKVIGRSQRRAIGHPFDPVIPLIALLFGPPLVLALHKTSAVALPTPKPVGGSCGAIARAGNLRQGRQFLESLLQRGKS